MNRRLVVALSLALVVASAVACHREQPAKAPPAAVKPARRLNLIDASRGGSVVSRTAEAVLELGAALMLDGSPSTLWSTPYNSSEQTVVLSLAAPARVDQIGLVVSATADHAPQKIAIESSLDGVTFTPLIRFTPGLVDQLQTRSVTPTVLRFLRISTIGTTLLAQIRELEVYGTEVGPVSVAPLAGTWTINGQPAHFTTIGARTFGVLADRDGPIFFDGGSDGRSYRFAWAQGPQAGRAIVTIAADGKHLSGIQWYPEVWPEHVGRTWYGERGGGAAPAVSGTEPMRAQLRRLGYFPLFGLRFNDADQLVESESDATLALVQALIVGTTARHFTFAAYELRADAATNRRRAEKRIASLRATLERRHVDLGRVSFTTVGLEQTRVYLESPVVHALYNVVDLRLDPVTATAR